MTGGGALRGAPRTASHVERAAEAAEVMRRFIRTVPLLGFGRSDVGRALQPVPMARDTALAACLARLGGSPFVSPALFVRRPSTLASYLALLISIH
jgi:hypothetical protein